MLTQSKRLLIRFAWLGMGFVLVLAACSTGPGAPRPTATPNVPLSDCHLSAPGSTTRLQARCGVLSVYEDRESGSGRMIDLHIAVFPASGRTPSPDPLFFLAGGPGQSAIETFPSIYAAFERIRQKRDIVLVDQRGTGGSNPLTCPAPSEDEPDEQETAAYLKACLEQMDANPALYTTWAAIQDLEQVRQELGYGKINLYGVSYGTRVALSYMDRYSENVRAVILDGVVPQDIALGVTIAADAQRALDQLFQRCEQDTACSQAFPEIEVTFQNLMATLEAEPVEVTLPHPTTGERETITFTPEMLATAVRLLSYSQETNALLPLLIHTAGVEQDYTKLAAQYLLSAGQVIESLNIGMHNTVVCTEDVPFISQEEATLANQNTYLGDTISQGLFDICTVWPRGEIPAAFKEPVQSDTPVLLLSGQVDPVTPPENAERAALTLPNSLHLVAAGQGHNVIFRGCLSRVAADFIENASAKGLNTGCVEMIQPMPFFVNFSGPTP